MAAEPGTVNRTQLQSYYQNPGDTYDDTKTEAAFNLIADQTDVNWRYFYDLLTNYVSTGQLVKLFQDQAAIGKYMQDIANGTAVTLEAYGDSTEYAFDSSNNGQVAIPPSTMLQNVLRAYYGNTAATVVNRGINGYGTTDALLTWTSDMAASTAKIIFINYGINDMQGATSPAISGEQYRQNLTVMVKTAREKGKSVILQTPNPVLSGGALGSQLKAEGVKQFADIVRQVARELHVPLVDSFRMVEEYASAGNSMLGAFPDGLHPNQAMYKLKGQLMASVLLAPATGIIDGPRIIPGAGPAVQSSGGTSGSFAATGSKMGIGKIGNKIRIPIYVTRPGLDIYVATPVWSVGTTVCTVSIDTETVATFSLRDGALSTNFGVDQEILIAENLAPGFHLIELNGNANEDCGLYYLRSRPTSKVITMAGADAGGFAPTTTTKPTLLTSTEVYVSGGIGQHHILFDQVPTSRVIKPLDIEVKATFGANEGFILFGHPLASNTASPRGGLLIYLDGTTGFLTVGEGTETAYNLTTIGAVDLRTASHTYRVAVTTGGVATIYVDGSNVGMYTQTKPHVGGFFGVYKYTAGAVTIDSVSIRG